MGRLLHENRCSTACSDAQLQQVTLNVAGVKQYLDALIETTRWHACGTSTFGGCLRQEERSGVDLRNLRHAPLATGKPQVGLI